MTHAPPRELCHRPVDVTRYTRDAVAYLLVIYATLGLGLAGVIQMWWGALVIAIAYGRGALLTHELIHVLGSAQVHPILRPMMLLDTPFGLGYREYRRIHLLHHRHATGPHDPERYQIAGSHGRALVAAMFASELAMIGWVHRYGLGRDLARETAARAVVFATVLAIDPAAFAVYWVTIRVTIGLANFAFHHMVHWRSGRLGSYRFSTVRWIDAATRVALGPTSRILFEHPAHHAWPRVRAEHLPGLLDRYPPTSAYAPAEAA